MAKVIKGQKPAGETAKPVELSTPKTGGRIIERDVYRAQQEAAEILKQGEAQRKQQILDGKRKAAQAKEEAMVGGASKAFADCAQESILMFRQRAKNCLEAQSNIQVLAKELVEKILGAPTTLAKKQIDQSIAKGIEKLMAQRKLKLQVGQGRLAALKLKAQPDLEIEEASDVSDGFIRVVTDVGSALCAEQVALDAFLSHIG